LSLLNQLLNQAGRVWDIFGWLHPALHTDFMLVSKNIITLKVEGYSSLFSRISTSSITLCPLSFFVGFVEIV